MDDQEIYQKIGQLLVDAGPREAKKLIARVKLFPEGDGGKYEFDYVAEAGVLNWFDPDGRAVGDLTDLLLQLREYFVTYKLTAGEGVWTGCEICLIVDEMNVEIKFAY